MGRWVRKLPPDGSGDRPPPPAGRTEVRLGCGPAHLFRDVVVFGVDRLFGPLDLEPQTATQLAARSHSGIRALAARVLRLLLARNGRVCLQAVSPPLHSPAAPARRQNMPAATVRPQARSCLHRSLFCGALGARASICASLVCNTATYSRQSAQLPGYQGSQRIVPAGCGGCWNGDARCCTTS